MEQRLYSTKLLNELEDLQSLDQFCEQWEQLRPLAIAVQALLERLFPAGARVIQLLIQIADAFCAEKRTD